MRVEPGDAFYIPDGWWHLIRSHHRNVAVAIEFYPFGYGEDQRVWPSDVAHRYRWPGLFWAESVTIKYAMRERYAASHYANPSTGKAIRCERLVEPTPLSALDWLGEH